MGKTKKIHFFKLNAIKAISDGNKKKEEISLGDSDCLVLLNKFYSGMESTKMGTKVKLYSGLDDFVLEIIEYEDQHIFAKIARQNLNNTIGVRNTVTFESGEVPIAPQHTLETFTYLYIDLKNLIISFLGIGGAPGVSIFKNIVNRECNKNDISILTSAILAKDIISMISKKDIVSKIEFTYATPSDDICANDLRLSEEEFKSVAKKKHMKKTVTISTREKRGIFNKIGNKVKDIFLDTSNQYGEKLSRFQVSARDYDEKTNSYNLLEYNFTESIDIEDMEKYKEDDYKNAIIRAYKHKKSQLEENLQ